MNNVFTLEIGAKGEAFHATLFAWAKVIDSNKCILVNMWEEVEEYDSYRVDKIFHFKYKEDISLYLVGSEEESIRIESDTLGGSEWIDFISKITNKVSEK